MNDEDPEFDLSKMKLEFADDFTPALFGVDETAGEPGPFKTEYTCPKCGALAFTTVPDLAQAEALVMDGVGVPEECPACSNTGEMTPDESE